MYTHSLTINNVKKELRRAWHSQKGTKMHKGGGVTSVGRVAMASQRRNVGQSKGTEPAAASVLCVRMGKAETERN